MNIKYYLAKIKCKLHKGNPEIMNQYYRKCGSKIGKNVLICSDISGGGNEASLIEIGDNTTISTQVSFITHDFSVKNLSPEMNNVFGKIAIGNNCFVGANTTLLYGINLCDNIIVAAGSVVTRSFNEPNIIIGGNPAKKISTWEKFYSNVKDKSMYKYNLLEEIQMHPEKLIIR